MSEILSALGRKDELAFGELVARNYPGMLRLASILATERARDIVRTAWSDLLAEGSVAGHGSVRTWLLSRVLKLAAAPMERVLPAAMDGRFEAADHPWAGHWVESVMPWPEDAANLQAAVTARSLRELPTLTAAVVLLRDVEQLQTDEVRSVLDLDADEQRVVLQDGRAGIRNALAASSELT
jgi:DNA-directed RNA polymerase specialized sigma24 family protein